MGYASNQVAISNDNINWQLSTLPTSKPWQQIIFNNKFIIMSQDNTSLSSVNGVNWQTSKIPANKDYS